MAGASNVGGGSLGNSALPLVSDNLLALIVSYRRGLEDFIANAPEDDDEAANAYADSSYFGPMLAIENWKGPAKTREGAIAAIKLAREASENGDRCLVDPLLSAAEGYLKSITYL